MDEDKDALAAEFVLGTLESDERADARLLLELDPGFAATLRDWERRLGELSGMVAPVEPPADMWSRIKARVEGVEPSPQVKLPVIVEAPKAPPAPGEVRGAEVVQLKRRAERWRAATALCGALAASLIGLIWLREFKPGVLPPPLQPRVVIREVPGPRPAEFVAVLQKDKFSPAFILTIDLDKRTFAVRTIGAERQAGKSFELWLVSDRYPAPRSLGVIGNNEFTVRRGLPEVDAATLGKATYAVSLEPEGGSPTGVPTGPVLFSGQLIQTTPPAFPAQTP